MLRKGGEGHSESRNGRDLLLQNVFKVDDNFGGNSIETEKEIVGEDDVESK
jgi:hypothetical protein